MIVAAMPITISPLSPPISCALVVITMKPIIEPSKAIKSINWKILLSTLLVLSTCQKYPTCLSIGFCCWSIGQI